MGEHAELKLIGGEVAILDKKDYSKLKIKDGWRIIHPKGKPTVIRYLKGKGANYVTLTKTLFQFHSQKQMIVFNNNNRLDFRRENMSFPRRNSNLSDWSAYSERKKAPEQLQIGECVITSSKKWTRPDKCMKCKQYQKCLDEVSKKTEWRNWEMSAIERKEVNDEKGKHSLHQPVR